MSAVDVTSKFLKVIWEHTHEEICARLKTIDKFAQCHVIITVTVPVVWPADARRRLYQAIQSANILGSNVRLARKFVTKAEAAGIALMSATSVYSGNLEVGRANPRTTYILRTPSKSSIRVQDSRSKTHLSSATAVEELQ
jgi:hypothetical protein